MLIYEEVLCIEIWDSDDEEDTMDIMNPRETQTNKLMVSVRLIVQSLFVSSKSPLVNIREWMLPKEPCSSTLC